MAMKYDLRYGGSVTGLAEMEAILLSVEESVSTGNWQAGKQAALMEKEAAKQLGVKHGILTTSGSCAGLLALSALELPSGSEVIIPAVTFPTIFNIILQCGLVPVVVDSKIGTYNLDPDELEKAISKKTRAIIAVHAAGNPVDMPKLMKHVNRINTMRAQGLAKYDKNYTNQKIYVIEDNCDGWGSSIGRTKVGAFGDISFTSFHAAHIVSMGVGGGVFTDNKKLAETVRIYRDWGRQADTTGKNKHKELPPDYNPRFIYEKIGYNFQILELQAAMGRVQLRKAKYIKKARQKNAKYLIESLGEYLITPRIVKGADVCWFSLPLTCTKAGERAKLVTFLEKHGIETRSLFSGNITKHPAYKNTKYRIGTDLTESNWIMRNSFWITVHPRLSQDDLDYIVSVFDTFYYA